MESLIDKFLKSRGLKVVILLTLAIVLVVSTLNGIKRGDCSSTYQEHYLNAYYAKVVDKFISKNHNYPIIQLENSKDLYAIGFEKTGLYTFVQVGDTILKKCNSLEYVVIRNDEHFSFKVDIPDCEIYKI